MGASSMRNPMHRATWMTMSIVVMLLVAVVGGLASVIPSSAESARPAGWADIATAVSVTASSETGETDSAGTEPGVEGATAANDGSGTSNNPPADPAPTESQANYLWAKSNELRNDNDALSLKPMDELMS